MLDGNGEDVDLAVVGQGDSGDGLAGCDRDGVEVEVKVQAVVPGPGRGVPVAGLDHRDGAEQVQVRGGDGPVGEAELGGGCTAVGVADDHGALDSASLGAEEG